MRILVTGGAGFIGSHLCARLIDDGHSVVCLDNLITGNESNVAGLRDQDRFEFVLGDVTQPFDFPVDVVYCLASPASPVGYLRHPYETALANGEGALNALRLAERQKARFLLASTSEVYGDPIVHPQQEDYWGNVNPNGIRSCYDESKRYAEALTMVFVRHYDLDARIVRIFNCFGPHSDPNDGRVVPNFITQALRGQPLTIYGSGTQTRSLCYVSDLVEGLVRAQSLPDTRGRVYNLGNPEERTVVEFAEVIKRLCASPSEIVFRAPISADDPQRRCPNITRAREELGWEPKVGLEDGLSRTIAWFRTRLGMSAR